MTKKDKFILFFTLPASILALVASMYFIFSNSWGVGESGIWTYSLLFVIVPLFLAGLGLVHALSHWRKSKISQIVMSLLSILPAILIVWFVFFGMNYTDYLFRNPLFTLLYTLIVLAVFYLIAWNAKKYKSVKIFDSQLLFVLFLVFYPLGFFFAYILGVFFGGEPQMGYATFYPVRIGQYHMVINYFMSPVITLAFAYAIFNKFKKVK